MSVKLEIELDRDAYRPGEVVSGRVNVVAGGHSRRLEVSLHYRERTADYAATAVTVPGAALHEGDLDAPASFPFSIALPADALPGHGSQHGRLWWEVDAKSDQRGPDAHARRELTITAAAR